MKYFRTHFFAFISASIGITLVYSCVPETTAQTDHVKELAKAFIPSIYGSILSLASIFIAVKYFFVTTVKERMMDSPEYQEWHRSRFLGRLDDYSIPNMVDSITTGIRIGLIVVTLQFLAMVFQNRLMVAIAIGSSLSVVIYFFQVISNSKKLCDFCLKFSHHKTAMAQANICAQRTRMPKS